MCVLCLITCYLSVFPSLGNLFQLGTEWRSVVKNVSVSNVPSSWLIPMSQSKFMGPVVSLTLHFKHLHNMWSTCLSVCVCVCDQPTVLTWQKGLGNKHIKSYFVLLSLPFKVFISFFLHLFIVWIFSFVIFNFLSVFSSLFFSGPGATTLHNAVLTFMSLRGEDRPPFNRLECV